VLNILLFKHKLHISGLSHNLQSVIVAQIQNFPVISNLYPELHSVHCPVFIQVLHLSSWPKHLIVAKFKT